jgi:hypothetical protein
MTGEEFAQAVAKQLGLGPLAPDEIDELLTIASTAAHASERLAAPLCTFIAGRSGRPLADVHAALGRVAGGFEDL